MSPLLKQSSTIQIQEWLSYGGIDVPSFNSNIWHSYLSIGHMEIQWTDFWQCSRKCKDNEVGSPEWPFRWIKDTWRSQNWHINGDSATSDTCVCVLAHPGARAFITHAGSHGLYEGLCHAVPMVMVPLSAEQPDNAEKMASRGAGIVLNILLVTTEDIVQALNDVINDTRWGESDKQGHKILCLFYREST